MSSIGELRVITGFGTRLPAGAIAKCLELIEVIDRLKRRSATDSATQYRRGKVHLAMYFGIGSYWSYRLGRGWGEILRVEGEVIADMLLGLLVRGIGIRGLALAAFLLYVVVH